MLNMLAPSDKKELEFFFSFINFYSRYLPKYSEVIEPFSSLHNILPKYFYSQCIHNVAFVGGIIVITAESEISKWSSNSG